MNKIIINFVFAAVLFCAAGTASAFAATSYEHCRCNQTTPGLSDNTSTCCNDATNNSYQNNNKDTCCQKVKGSTYSWTGTGTTWSSSGCTAAVTCASTKVNVNGVCKTPCSNYWITTQKGIRTTTTCDTREYLPDYVVNSSCSYYEDCDCCVPPGICSNGQITSITAVCNAFGSNSTECICAGSSNGKQCAPLVYGSTADEVKCIQSGFYSPYCECSNFINYWSGTRPSWQDFACIGYPAKCTSSGTN